MADKPPDHYLRVGQFWDDVLEDMHRTAEDLRDDGWTVAEVHTGDVTVVLDDQPGFDVLVPDNEYEDVEAMVDDADAFSQFQVFKQVEGDLVYLLISLQDPDNERAIMVPAYYDHRAETELVDRIEEGAAIWTKLRPLADDRRIAFSHRHTSAFHPEADLTE